MRMDRKKRSGGNPMITRGRRLAYRNFPGMGVRGMGTQGTKKPVLRRAEHWLQKQSAVRT